MTKTNTLESKRKLIDLPVDVMSTLSDIAKGRRMSLKSYIESLAIAAAKEMSHSEKDASTLHGMSSNKVEK